MPEPFETWRPVPGYEAAYEVSDLGRVRSLPRKTARGVRGGQVIFAARKNGCRVAYLCWEGHSKPFKVARLVALAFHGPPPPGKVARHLDGDTLNNLSTNISWGGRTSGNAFKTHCVNDHPFNEANTLHYKGLRLCRACRRDRKRRPTDA